MSCEKAISESDVPTRDMPQTGTLPSNLRLLCVDPEEPSWINLTLHLDAENCHDPHFRWVSSSGEALGVLRNESFDCVLVDDSRTVHSESSRAHDAFSLIQAIRGSGYDDPLILLTRGLDDDRWQAACRWDCEVLVVANAWESRALVPVIKRALGRVELSRENHRLAIAQQRRMLRERDEAEQLLQQQRQMIHDLQAMTKALHDDSPVSEGRRGQDGDPAASTNLVRPSIQLPHGINDYYHELLRTYVIMGSGGMGSEISRLAEILSLAGISTRETLELHLERVESLVRGLGSRSARHVMARADLLALELMIHLGEFYQQKARSTSEE